MRVFVADDNDMVKQTLAKILHRLGYTTLLATDAIDALGQSGLDVVIVERNFRACTMNGEELWAEWLQQNRQTPFILMHTGMSEQEEAEFEMYGAVLLNKPFAINDVVKALDHAGVTVPKPQEKRREK